MPLYRVDLKDGGNHVVTALRVLRRGDEYAFQDPQGPGVWRTSLQVPSSAVQGITRRVTELNGSNRWVSEKPQEQPWASTDR